jgi:hypothetical protein
MLFVLLYLPFSIKKMFSNVISEPSFELFFETYFMQFKLLYKALQFSYLFAYVSYALMVVPSSLRFLGFRHMPVHYRTLLLTSLVLEAMIELPG